MSLDLGDLELNLLCEIILLVNITLCFVGKSKFGPCSHKHLFPFMEPFITIWVSQSCSNMLSMLLIPIICNNGFLEDVIVNLLG